MRHASPHQHSRGRRLLAKLLSGLQQEKLREEVWVGVVKQPLPSQPLQYAGENLRKDDVQ